ncbi:hypothetical protein MTR67_030148 [Solanum verrucosum]|uniref:AWS domain-containing protein n=1 Tax=Solanum verrucosum TaxID=315347 RepID=A0AAF0R8T0_SOLVR|nr:hypothetical protein MTR67_030148 [Solanum verrucosum]
MHDKLQALVAIIALVPVLKFCLSETKGPVACTALNFKWFGLGTSMLEVSSSKPLASESKGFAFWVELIAPGFSSAGYLSYVVQLPEGVTPFMHITQNEFIWRKHKKPREEDIAISECKYDASDPNSACVGRCLNLLTNIECTPGYYPCGDTCRNQSIDDDKTRFGFQEEATLVLVDLLT